MSMKRKKLRIPAYDYSQNGAYFVTVCTHGNHAYFGAPGEDTPAKRAVMQALGQTMEVHAGCEVMHLVVMPDHFHAIVMLQDPGDGAVPVSLSAFMQTFKRLSTIAYSKEARAGAAPRYDGKLWQRSFHDRVIRNEQEYLAIWEYIENNPKQWELDRH